MATIYDIEPNELIEKAAEELKKVKEIEPPAWASYVKTGRHKERAPVKIDWWYARTAAILRYIYRVGPIGVSKLRAKYGGKRRRGHKPSHFYKGSGSITRKVLQQLEKAGFLKKTEKGENHKGRRITPKGKSFLDKIASQLAGKFKRETPVKEEKPKPVEKKPEVKEEKKETKADRPKEIKKEKPKEEKLPTTEELVRKTKEFAKRKKKITAEDLVEEAKKQKNG